MQKRLEYVDVAKGIGILFVLFGHILPDKSVLKALIYTFHMPLFFFLHGVVAKPRPIREVLSRRGRSLLVPYFLWGIAFTGFTVSERLLFLLWGTGEAIHIVKTNGMLWFLATMFVSSFISGLFLRLSGKISGKRGLLVYHTVICVLLMALSVFFYRYHKTFRYEEKALGLPLSLDVSLLGASLIIAGQIFRIITDGLHTGEKKEGKAWASALALTVPVAVFALSVYLGFALNRDVGTYPSMQVFRLGKVPVYWITALAACGCVALISKWITDRFSRTGWIAWLGSNSLGLFIMHKTIRSQVRDFLATRSSPVYYAGAFIVILAYSCICTFVANRYIPAMVGKTRAETAPKHPGETPAQSTQQKGSEEQ